MQRFKFKLQPVLHHRQKKEDILKKELADIKLVFEKEKLILDNLKTKLAQLQAELRIAQKATFDSVKVLTYSNCINRVEREVEFQLIKLTDIASEVRKAQERLLQASKDKKVLEKLSERRYEEYREETEKSEQKAIDEIATIRYNSQDVSSLKEY